MVHTEVGNKIVFVPFVCVLLELAVSGGLGFALDGVTGWNRLTLSCYNPWLAALSSFAEGSGIGCIAVAVKDVMINSKVGDGVVFIPWIGILLKLCGGSSLGLALNRIAGGNGGFLGSNLPLLATSGTISSAVCLGSGGIRVSSNNVVVHSEIGNKVVFIPWVSIFLKFSRGGGLCLAFNRVASWD